MTFGSGQNNLQLPNVPAPEDRSCPHTWARGSTPSSIRLRRMLPPAFDLPKLTAPAAGVEYNIATDGAWPLGSGY